VLLVYIWGFLAAKYEARHEWDQEQLKQCSSTKEWRFVGAGLSSANQFLRPRIGVPTHEVFLFSRCDEVGLQIMMGHRQVEKLLSGECR
jgi:hypothetical protein